MSKKYKLEEVKEFVYNPFFNYRSEVEFDEFFIDELSNKAKNIIKYLMCKHSFKEEKLLFKLNEFNRFMIYINMKYPCDGIAELCSKKVLAKTKDPDLYWVNNDFFRTGIFQPRYMECIEEDRYK
ncbi:hypothetical protein CE557_045 [Cardinium endosymbiont of Sogatella furcifera]|uniref:hypothetical protein n=1 Tax=Cardinium endosymbiont of Sogatella furcifera TaxID=650378 RepID=UPI000E104AD4|nr:hypothetical protein [Cardinium endosymbiont of Sogatella furcifera]AXI23892.1 hypothetical protein CE557_045 [Cardinium endosymbiont of Sogatella furcifera]